MRYISLPFLIVLILLTASFSLHAEEEPDAPSPADPGQQMEQMQTEGKSSDPFSTCYEDMFTERARRHCLLEQWEDAESTMKQAAEKEQRQTNALSKAPQRREAIRALSSSNMSFSAFRDSECRRRHIMNGLNTAKGYDTELACKIILTRLRTTMLQKL